MDFIILDFINDSKIKEDLLNMIDARVKACHYDEQTRVDFCCSSGILIALELTRAYRNGSVPNTLRPPTYRKQRIIKELHKEESALQTLKPLHERRVRQRV